VNTHPFDLKFFAFCPKFSGDSWLEFEEKTILGEFFRNFVPYFLRFLFCVRIALKKFTQVLSYVICAHVRQHVHKRITKRRYGEEKPGCFFPGKLVLFTLCLGLTTPYSLVFWSEIFTRRSSLCLLSFCRNLRSRFVPQDWH